MGINYNGVFTHAVAALKELDAAHTQTKQELENEKSKKCCFGNKKDENNLETQLASIGKIRCFGKQCVKIVLI